MAGKWTSLLLLFVSLSSLVNAGYKTTETKAAIEKSLPFLWREGQAWIDKRGCVSCHQVPFMLWSLNSAANKGFEVDQAKLKELLRWSTDINNFTNPMNDDKADQSEADTANGNIDTMAQLLLAMNSSGKNSGSVWKEKFVNYLVTAQKADGTWNACGQLPFQKRPKPETTAITTLWTAISLSGYDADTELKVSIPASESSPEIPGVSIEWWSVRLLQAKQSGDAESVANLQLRMTEFQNKDGGWGWLTSDESDAFGTGLAVYALLKSGFDEESSSIHSAKSFLLETQEQNGSWKVRSTKGAHQKKVTPTATYWGTAWAVIALLETVQEEPSHSVPK